ncbi:MAG: hypothetical protein ACYDDA_09870 [Acidiferrobacteraceae bacterium]
MDNFEMKMGPFSAPAIFKGQLIRLEDKDATRHAGILDAQGRIWSGEMPIGLAVQMRELLFEWVLVEGIANWTRSEEGAWGLTDFHIGRCEALSKSTLKEDIRSLRSITDNRWKKMQDPIGFIRESRNDMNKS